MPLESIANNSMKSINKKFVEDTLKWKELCNIYNDVLNHSTRLLRR